MYLVWLTGYSSPTPLRMNANRIIFISLSLIGMGVMFSSGLPFTGSLLLVLAILTGLWGVSLLIRDASIVDIFWGPGFAIQAWYYFFVESSGPGNFRNILLCLLVSIWAVRLALHIGIRNWGKGEDFRYRQWRTDGGKNYWWISWLRVFVLQGLLMWVVGSILLISQSEPRLIVPTGLDLFACLLWLVGFYFEAVGDWQLVRFKRNPANQGKVMNTGLWKYTRHPNYFGDAVIWWAWFLFAVQVPFGWAFIAAPLLMTFLLMKVSGAALLETTLRESKPKYAEYIRKTSAFFPWIPKP